ncbi:hypothetical protein [Pelosinus sp. sgz500959]|uniref:hypothetical protein n=1 Tax=Pelosinus sp. sgz500959 TaxID=3242472 RepID=UPI00366D8748
MYQTKKLFIMIGVAITINLMVISNVFAENSISNFSITDKSRVGICIFASSNILGDKENEAYFNVENAVKNKFLKEKFIIDHLTSTDFKNYLGKKEILVSDMQELINGVKLPMIVDFGLQNNLDYVVIVICDATTEQVKQYNSKMFYNSFTHKYQSYGKDQISVNKVGIISRIALVNVKNHEYVYNIMINKSRNEEFRTDTRAIRAIVEEWTKSFDSDISTTTLDIAK